MNSKFQFTVTKFSGLDGHTHVRWEQKTEATTHPFTVTATPLGVSVSGNLIGVCEDDEDMAEIARVWATAWEVYRNGLKKKVALG